MKNLFLFSTALITLSCSEPSKQEIIIGNYVQTIQTIGNTKTDMDFELLEIEETNTITNRDSLAIILSQFYERDFKSDQVGKNVVDTVIKVLTASFEYGTEVLSDYRYKLDSLEQVEISINNQTSSEVDAALKKMSIGQFKLFYSETIYKWTEDSIQRNQRLRYFNRLNEKELEVLCRVFKVKYSINNPNLNGVKQEITGTFYLNSTADKILLVQ